MRRIQPQTRQKDGLLVQAPLSPLFLSHLSSFSSSSPPPLQSPPSSASSKISSAVLSVIVILAAIFFICGLLHLLVRFLIKKRASHSPNSQSNRYPAMGTPDTYQRQLQQLFNLHDSGLDQTFIDALPVFLYKEIMGLKEPFDCAVCLCEFSELDMLRLLPLCTHAFHIHCIDTWLLSNSTCPLCRGTLFDPGFSIENPIFDFDDLREEDEFSGNIYIGATGNQKEVTEGSIGISKRVFSVSLGKFRTTNNGERSEERETGETSNSNLNARRCYSMGSCQYVVDNADLQVAFCPGRSRRVSGGPGGGNDGRFVKEKLEQSGNSLIDGDSEGKKIIGSKGESFSVSKIWLWSKKGRFPSSSGTHMVNSSVNLSLPSRDV